MVGASGLPVGAVDDGLSRNPNGEVEYRGDLYDCGMCAREAAGVKKKVIKQSGIGRCRLELARLARAMQLEQAEAATAPAAAVANSSTAPPLSSTGPAKVN